MSLFHEPPVMLKIPATLDCRSPEARRHWLASMRPRIWIRKWLLEHRPEIATQGDDSEWVPPFLRLESGDSREIQSTISVEAP